MSAPSPNTTMQDLPSIPTLGNRPFPTTQPVMVRLSVGIPKPDSPS